jgi:hypothetical protein
LLDTVEFEVYYDDDFRTTNSMGLNRLLSTVKAFGTEDIKLDYQNLAQQLSKARTSNAEENRRNLLLRRSPRRNLRQI